MQITLDENGIIHGLLVKTSWKTKLDETTPADERWVLDNMTIDYSGIHIMALAKESTKQLVVARAKKERECNDTTFIESFSGKTIHYSSMGRKLVSAEQTYNDARIHADTLTDEAKRKLAEELLDSLN